MHSTCAAVTQPGPVTRVFDLVFGVRRTHFLRAAFFGLLLGLAGPGVPAATAEGATNRVHGRVRLHYPVSEIIQLSPEEEAINPEQLAHE
jgi:hypothetical protein